MNQVVRAARHPLGCSLALAAILSIRTQLEFAFGAGVITTSPRRLRWLGWRSPQRLRNGLDCFDGAAVFTRAHSDRSPLR